MAVADAWSAMTSGHPYHLARSAEEAIHGLRRSAGTQVDPIVVVAIVAESAAEEAVA
ncbi:hypothetical protein [Solwaraspora sp. WMMA2065]|uniref:hypothetical protein n=1 Tax=Solwaraspora sp. WMMA2065 TaxID=3015166 RepID=UPI00259B94BD|nr:hypothetical protein [Solwaraspora sp. WMMA2065]WJK33046.1 hypothetical protein O7610_20280 [Solwaraspora sp. WMMA2065]